MHRFFVPPEWIDGDSVTLSGDVARRLTRVLRVRAGEQIVVLDGTGYEHAVTVQSVERDRMLGLVNAKTLGTGEPGVRVTLYQGMLKADKYEYVLQKSTELGIARFVPVVCARSIARERDGVNATRLLRWKRIVTEAAEQSRRSILPGVLPPMEFSGACEKASGLALIPWEEERSLGLRSLLMQWLSDGIPSRPISIFIGPEGGFTSEEVAYARSKGIMPVTLGRRILRAETAGIVTAAAVLYELGELGG